MEKIDLQEMIDVDLDQLRRASDGLEAYQEGMLNRGVFCDSCRQHAEYFEDALATELVPASLQILRKIADKFWERGVSV